MIDITKPSGYNIGGLAKIQVCPVELVSSIPDPVAGVISSPVSFATGGRWFDIYNTFESIWFKQPSMLTNQGKHYEISVEGFIPGQTAELDFLFNQIEQKRHIIKAWDLNGHRLLICSIKSGSFFGAALKVDYDSQSLVSGRKGYRLLFSLLSGKRAYWYTYQGSGSGS
jgi:hypothetical protein